MALSNQQLLTRGDQKYAKKKRAKLARPAKVEYDPKSREEYLTGFHKRKLKRKEESKKRAEEYIKKAKKDEKRLARAEKQKSIEKGLQKLREAEKVFNGEALDSENEQSGSGEDEDGEFKGFTDSSGILKKPAIQQVYGEGQDEARVTIQEVSIDPFVDLSRAEDVLQMSTRRAHEYAKYVESLENPQPKPKKVRVKKFKYLSKSQRLIERKKQTGRK